MNLWVHINTLKTTVKISDFKDYSLLCRVILLETVVDLQTGVMNSHAFLQPRRQTSANSRAGSPCFHIGTPWTTGARTSSTTGTPPCASPTRRTGVKCAWCAAKTATWPQRWRTSWPTWPRAGEFLLSLLFTFARALFALQTDSTSRGFLFALLIVSPVRYKSIAQRSASLSFAKCYLCLAEIAWLPNKAGQ